MKCLNVLIADSDSQLCRLYGDFLAREGYAVEVATGGVACMSRLRRFRPAVLVISQDLLWGGAAGVLSRLRHEGPPFPGVVLTTCGLDEPQEDLLAAGVVCVLLKPFRLEALRQAVHRAASVSDPVSPAWADAERAQAQSELSPSSRPRPGKTGVLVVDDEAGVRELVGAALLQQGYGVWTASSGHEAVEVYRQHCDKIELALLDVRMPGLSGPQTLLALHSINPRLRCAFMTGDLGNDRTREWLERSGLPVLVKPFPMTDLTRLVDALAAPGAVHAAVAGEMTWTGVPIAESTS